MREYDIYNLKISWPLNFVNVDLLIGLLGVVISSPMVDYALSLSLFLSTPRLSI